MFIGEHEKEKEKLHNKNNAMKLELTKIKRAEEKEMACLNEIKHRHMKRKGKG